MTTYAMPICRMCKHETKKGEEDDGNYNGWRCAAYPEGIPPEIELSTIDHREEYEGDNGVTFELDEDAMSEAQFADYAKSLFPEGYKRPEGEELERAKQSAYNILHLND